MSRCASIWLALGICVASAGCESGVLPVHTVAGTVLFRGEPAAGALVIFHPKQAQNPNEVKRPSARVGDDGTFALTTRQSGDGAPTGEYGVSIVWFDDEGRQESSGAFGAPQENAGNPDRLKGKYANPANSGLATVTIGEGHNELPPFNLE